MIAYAPQLILVEQFRECRRKIMGRNQRPHLVHANVFQIPIVIALSAHTSVFCLLLFDFQELFFENRYKGSVLMLDLVFVVSFATWTCLPSMVQEVTVCRMVMVPF